MMEIKYEENTLPQLQGICVRGLPLLTQSFLLPNRIFTVLLKALFTLSSDNTHLLES